MIPTVCAKFPMEDLVILHHKGSVLCGVVNCSTNLAKARQGQCIGSITENPLYIIHALDILRDLVWFVAHPHYEIVV